MGAIRDHFLRCFVYFFPDAQGRGTAPSVVCPVLPALIFWQLHKCGVPAIGPQSRGRVDGKSKIVPDLCPSQPLRYVLVKQGSPHSRWIHLAKSSSGKYTG